MERCPDGACAVEWDYIPGTAFRIPQCIVCGRVDGYRIQGALDHLLSAERKWVLEAVAGRVAGIPENERWEFLGIPLISVERVRTIIEDVRADGNRRGSTT